MYVQCNYIVKTKYQIAPSKAVVGVDWPMKELSMHIQKPYKGKIVSFLIAVILSKIIILNQTASCICSMCLHCEDKYQIAASKAVEGVDRLVYAISQHKPCIESHYSTKGNNSNRIGPWPIFF